jgi:molecular chaperone GrpE
MTTPNQQQTNEELQATEVDNVQSSAVLSKEEEYLAGWKRALADYENLKKMTDKQKEDDRRQVRSRVADALLPVIENFGYVTRHSPRADDMPEEQRKSFVAWYQGIEHIERQFMDVLAVLGVEPIATIGQSFDPHVHEAVGTRAEEGKEKNIVLEELARGWKIGDYVLRPAKVIVSE